MKDACHGSHSFLPGSSIGQIGLLKEKILETMAPSFSRSRMMGLNPCSSYFNL